VQGAGVLSLSAHDADGNPIDLFNDTSKKPVQFDITVGGDIEIEHSIYSTPDGYLYRETSFVLQFGLSCLKKNLT